MNFTIKDFNNKLNNSMENPFSDWENYRNSITSFLLDSIDDLKCSSNMIILGAGRCNDININVLIDHVQSLTLSDIDINSIKNGIKSQGITKKAESKISILSHDYSGLESIDFFPTLYEKVIASRPMSELLSYINETLKKIKFTISAIDIPLYDIVVSLPVYTQLAYPQFNMLMNIINEYALYTPSELEFFKEEMIAILPTFIANYNELLLRLLKKNAMIIVLSDIIEYNPNMPDYNKLASQTQDLIYMEKWHKTYTNKYGYGLGSYGLLHLTEALEIKQEKWFVWPFNSQRYFLVKGICGILI